MEQNKKNSKKAKNNNAQMKANKKQPAKPAQQKDRKSNRVKQLPISGFSTLSQVSGAPLLKSHRSNISVPPQTSVVEPRPICPNCGQPIELIAEAFSNANGEYVHFDCVLAEISAAETLTENQTVSYIGSGCFGVCEKNEDGKYTIIKKINYESSEKLRDMKSYVESLKK